MLFQFVSVQTASKFPATEHLPGKVYQWLEHSSAPRKIDSSKFATGDSLDARSLSAHEQMGIKRQHWRHGGGEERN